jgi:hypothetical protein
MRGTKVCPKFQTLPMKKLIALVLAIILLVGPLVFVLKRPSEPLSVALARMPDRLRQVTGQGSVLAVVFGRKRVAQHLCSVYSAGVAAGVPWQGSTKKELIRDVLNGRSSETGPWKDHVFRFNRPAEGNTYVDVAVWDWSEIARFIKLTEGSDGRILVYDPNGSEPIEPSLAGAGLDTPQVKSK